MLGFVAAYRAPNRRVHRQGPALLDQLNNFPSVITNCIQVFSQPFINDSQK
jgi:hypothetical protein